jgi:predicted branched-subunit amino acid permease
MPELLREALRSPRELLAMLASLLAAMVLTSPLPIFWWVLATLLLAAVPGTILMNRVRVRAEQRARTRQHPAG